MAPDARRGTASLRGSPQAPLANLRTRRNHFPSPRRLRHATRLIDAYDAGQARQARQAGQDMAMQEDIRKRQQHAMRQEYVHLQCMHVACIYQVMLPSRATSGKARTVSVSVLGKP